MAGQGLDKDILAGLAEAQKDELALEKKGLAGSLRDDESDEVDDVHAGLEFPTEEEKQTLRRVSDTLPLKAYRECINRFAVRASADEPARGSDCGLRDGGTVLVLRLHRRLCTLFSSASFPRRSPVVRSLFRPTSFSSLCPKARALARILSSLERSVLASAHQPVSPLSTSSGACGVP